MCGLGTVFGKLGSFLDSTDAAAGQAKVNAAKLDLRNSKNEVSAAQANAQRVNQQLANQHKVEAAAGQFAVMQGNLARSIDQQTVNTSMGMLKVAEQAGAVTAQAAAAGVGGSTVERMKATLAVQGGQQKAMADRAEGQTAINGSRQAGEVIANGYNSMDNQFIAANIDKSYMGKTSYSPFGDLAKLGVAVGATKLGAPQIGEAILDQATASDYADAGNAQASQAARSSMFTALKGSGQEWSNVFSKVGIHF